MRVERVRLSPGMARALVQEMRVAAATSILKASRTLRREVIRRQPVDTGALRRSTRNAPVDVDSVTDRRTIILGGLIVGAKYGRVVDQGRKPGKWPNVDAIRAWVKRKLLAVILEAEGFTGREFKRRLTKARKSESRINSLAYLVGKKIKEQGIDPVHFLREGFRAARAQIERDLVDGVVRAAKRAEILGRKGGR